MRSPWPAGARRGLTAPAGVLLLALLLGAPSPLGASPAASTTHFAAERLRSAPGGRGGLCWEDAAVAGELGGAVQLLLSHAERPLSLELAEAERPAGALPVVQRVTALHLSGALELGRRLRLGLSLPLLWLAGEGLSRLGEPSDIPGFFAGDLAISATATLWRGGAIPLALALGARFTLPTGDAQNFAGGGTVGFAPRLLFGARPWPWLRLGSELGAELSDGPRFFGATPGRRLLWAMGGRLALPWIPRVGRALGLGLEVAGELGPGGAPDRLLELRGGVGASLPRGLGLWLWAGGGLLQGAGEPLWRIVAAASWRYGSE